MTDDTTLRVGVEADASQAVNDMRAAATAASDLADSFREIASVAVTAARALTKAEQGVTGTARAGKQAAQNVQAATNALKEQSDAAKTLSQNLLEVARRQQSGGRVFAVANSGQANALQGYSKPLDYSEEAASLRRLSDVREANIRLIRQTVEANIAESKSARESATANKSIADAMLQAQRQRSRRYAEPQRASNNVIPNGLEVDGVRVGASFGQIEEAAKGATGAVDSFRNGLFTARFALNDISNATGIAGAALIAFNAASVNAASTYESAFASIRRTSGATLDELKVIENQFIDLAQSIPGGFNNLAQIGELAGQLNIPTQRIASFTEVVAQFTSSTDVAVQASAEAFGRLDTLLPDVQGNYEALGSSILNVGVNSVATESSIISTTTQIAAAGAQARFTADEVIGLAASYASLGIAPEAARGSTIRIFSEIRQAAAEGGDALDEFARIAGMSAAEFRDAWNSGDSSELFLDFLRGLQREGTGAETALRDLGVTGVRDINALLRLSQNVDIVTDAFGDANAGFRDATQLGEAFGITSETLNSRLEVLGQSFQALFATLGESGTGPIKEFINLLIDAIKVMTEIAKNPAAQWIAIFGGLFTLIAGGVLVLTSLVARLGSAAVAVRILRADMLAWRTEIAATNTQLTAMQSRLLGAGLAATNFTNILKGLAYGTAITAGITLLIAGFTALGEATKSSGDRAKDAFGDLSGLTSALQSDSKTFEETGERIGQVQGTITRTVDDTADWVTAVESATGAHTNLATEADRTRQIIEQYTYSIGENTAAWLANQLANNEAIVKMIQNNQKLATLGAPTADTSGLISAAARNDVEAAKRIIAEYEAEVDALRARMEAKGDNLNPALLAAEDQLTRLKEAFDITTGALTEAATKGEILETTYAALGLTVPHATDALDDSADAATSAADRFAELRQSIEDSLSGFTAIADFGGAIESLFTGIAKSGVESFDVLGSVGQSNLSNLQTAISTTIIAGESLGVSAVDSVAALFLELQRRGIDTANLLASLASIPGIGTAGVNQIKSTLSGTRQLSGSSLDLSKALGTVATSATDAAKAVGGGSRGLGRQAKEAAQQVRTLTDYAGDLSAVFKRAFDIRFGAQSGLDGITSEWISMREAIDDANKAITEIQRKMAELRTENNTLQYFLGVAENYQDTLRAAEIRSQIAKNNAELAKEEENAADAGKIFNKTLTGNSKTAIDNRKQITSLVQQYQDLISSYAASGLDQAALSQKTAELRQQFLAQAQALGFNSNELQQYAFAFDDVALAINRVPRNITVAANVNPAIQALNELEAKARSTASNVGSALGGAFNGANAAAGANLSGLANRMQLMQQYLDANAQAAVHAVRAVTAAIRGDAITAFAERLSSTTYAVAASAYRRAGGFRQGGYTGGNSPSNVQGVVHGKEYVINAQNTQRLGVPFLNAINGGMGSGGSGVIVVELSAYDRSLLAANGNVQLNIDGRAIAGATNGANFVSTKRGSS